MGIDSSIYFQQQGTPDVVGSIAKGIQMRDLMRKQDIADREDRTRALLANAVDQDPTTGRLSLNPQKFGKIAGNDYDAGMLLEAQAGADKQKRDAANMDLDAFAKKVSMGSQLLGGVTDDRSYQMVKPILVQHGIYKPEELPPSIDQVALHAAGFPTDWLEQHKQMGIAAEKQIEQKISKQRADAETMNAQTKKEEIPLKHEENMTRLADVKERTNARISDQDKRQENQIHERVVARIQRDPILNAKFNQYNNLTSALSNFENAEVPTAQAFDELQQAVRANLGIKGQSAVGEREHTTMNSLGLNAARMMQFLSGDPKRIETDKGFAKHMRDLVRLERENIDKQVNNRLGALSGGHGSMYRRRQDLKGDLMEALNGQRDQFSSGSAPAYGAGTQAPQTSAQGAPDYHSMSNEQLEALYNQKVRGANANAR